MLSPQNQYYLDGEYEHLFEHQKDIATFSSVYSAEAFAGSNIELDAALQKQINYQSFDELVDFYNQNEKHFKELYEELHIDFWFLEHFRLYFKYRNFSLKTACIRQFLEKEGSNKVLSSDKNLLHFFDASHIQLEAAAASPKKGYQRFLKEIRAISYRLKFPGKPRQKRIILSRMLDNKDGRDKRFGSLESAYEKILTRELLDASNPMPDLQAIPRELATSDQIFLRYLLQFRWPFDLLKLRKSLKRLKEQLSSPANLASEKHRVMLDLFWKGKMSFFVYYLRFRAFDAYFTKTKITGILLSDENSPQQKAIQYAAFKNKIQIFGFQHGNIHDLHPAYIYGKYHSKPLLPDITFTWGKYFTDLLLRQGGYGPEQVRTVGRIEAPGELRFLNPILNDFDTNKKTIIYASQPQRDPLLRKQHLKDVLLATQANRDSYQLIIRPHPRELDDNYFLKIGKEVGFQDFVIDRQSDLKTHFEFCDLLITSFSTVGTEFIPYYKPLLVLDYLDQDLASWIREKVGIQVKKPGELADKIRQDTFVIDKASYDTFVENYFYKADGQASERIRSIIDEK